MSEAATDVAWDAACADAESLRAALAASEEEKVLLSMRIADLEAAAEVDEQEMEEAMREMEVVLQDLHTKLVSTQNTLEEERQEFGRRLQMLALEGADQELTRRELADELLAEKEKDSARDSGEEEDDAGVVGNDAGAATERAAEEEGDEDIATLKSRIKELENELKSMRLSRHSSGLSAAALQTIVSPVGVAALSPASAEEEGEPNALESFHNIMEKTIADRRSRKLERARSAAEAAALQLAAGGADRDNKLFTELIVSAALTAISPDNRVVKPGDEEVQAALAKGRRDRSESMGKQMRAWEDQPTYLLQLELTKRGIPAKAVQTKADLVAMLNAHDEEMRAQM